MTQQVVAEDPLKAGSVVQDVSHAHMSIDECVHMFEDDVCQRTTVLFEATVARVWAAIVDHDVRVQVDHALAAQSNMGPKCFNTNSHGCKFQVVAHFGTRLVSTSMICLVTV